MKLIFSIILLMWIAVVAIISFFYPASNDALITNHQIVNFLIYGILSLFLMSRMQFEKRYSPQTVLSVTISAVIIFSGTIEIVREFYVQHSRLNIINFVINSFATVLVSVAYRKWIWNHMKQLIPVSFKKMDMTPALGYS